MLDALVVLLVIAVMGFVAVAALTLDTRRRVRRRVRTVADRAVDDLATDACDGLAHADDGSPAQDRALHHYAAARDEVAAARSLSDLAAAAAKARARSLGVRGERELRRTLARLADRASGPSDRSR